MLSELMFVAAFALFAVFAWIKITDAEQRAGFYRECYKECLGELELRQSIQRSQSEYTSRLREELDTRGMEVGRLEHQLQETLDENEALRARLAGYWSMSN